MNKSMKLRYIEQSDNEQGFEEFTISAEEAIERQKQHVEKLRQLQFVKPNFSYSDDETALLDFIAVHWAQIVSE